MLFSTSLVYKILAVFLLFSFSKASGGTCLSYGHSCWGGHGKRSGMGQVVGPANSQKRTSEWYLTRLLNSPFLNSKFVTALLKNQKEEEIDKFRPYGYQIYPASDIADSGIRNKPIDSDAELYSKNGKPDASESDEDIVFLTSGFQQIPLSKYKLFQIMNEKGGKRKEKKNDKLNSFEQILRY